MGGSFCVHSSFDGVAFDADGGDVVFHSVFSPNKTNKKARFDLAGLSKHMNFKDIVQRDQTNRWLAANGINVAHIYAGSAELFQATKLATATLKNCGRLLEQDQTHTLNQFLQAVRVVRKRDKLTQGQCFKVMNIAKQVQRKLAKSRKAKR